MDTNKIMLKAIVLTALMQSLAEQGKHPNSEQAAVIEAFNEELDAAEAASPAAMDRPIDEVYLDLMDAVDTLEEVF